MIWLAIALGSAACFATKLAGLAVPPRLLGHNRVQRLVAIVPTGLLAALVGLQTFTTGHSLVIDARAAGLVVAGVALWRRAPFLVVVALAAAIAATLRYLS